MILSLLRSKQARSKRVSEQTQLRLELKKEAFGWFIKQLSPVIDCAFSARFCRDATPPAAPRTELALAKVNWPCESHHQEAPNFGLK